MVNTKATRIARAAQFFPAHFKMPQTSPGDVIPMAAQDHIIALQNPNHQALVDLEPKHNDALKRLAAIFFYDTVKNHTEIFRGGGGITEGEPTTINLS